MMLERKYQKFLSSFTSGKLNVDQVSTNLNEGPDVVCMLEKRGKSVRLFIVNKYKKINKLIIESYHSTSSAPIMS